MRQPKETASALLLRLASPYPRRIAWVEFGTNEGTFRN